MEVAVNFSELDIFGNMFLIFSSSLVSSVTDRNGYNNSVLTLAVKLVWRFGAIP